MKTYANFYAHIEQSLLLYAEKKLIIWGNNTFTGKDILENVHKYQKNLQKLQLQNGNTVILATSPSPNTFFMILALMSQGITSVIPPFQVSIQSFFKILKKLNAQGVVTERPNIVKKILGKILKIKIIDIFSDEESNFIVSTQKVLATQNALISYSSGSTGDFKAVFRSHQVLLAQHQAIKKEFPPFENQIDFPLFTNILLHNLAVGVLSVMPAIEKFSLLKVNMEIICEQIHNEKISSLTGNVFYFARMVQYLKQKPMKLSSVKALGIGGSPVSERLLSDLKAIFDNASVYVIYGSSEAEPIAVRKVEYLQKPLKGFCVGRISESLEIKIEPIGELNIENTLTTVGEIYVRGHHVALKEGESWFKTGDFGYQNEERILYLTGRKGNETIIGGVQHYMIEHMLLCMEYITQVAAIANEDKFDIYVVSKLTKQEIQNIVYQYIEKNIIGEIYIEDALPTDHRHHSKILYQQIK
ncbi:MAG: AMP-binding protein [Raineya sp.]|jgi:long-subunit acyl-CoA synthetase (AMP-forming)|nr:AMP-binding protein [Raineya sp.]